MKVVYIRSVQGCFLYGCAKDLPPARDYLHDLASWTSLSFSWNAKHIAVLLARQGTLCHLLETSTHTLIHINKTACEITAEGGIHSLQALQQQYQTIFDRMSCYACLSSFHSF